MPSSALPNVVGALADRIGSRASVLLLSKGFVQPMGALPNEYVSERVRARAIACLGGPAHAREAVAGMAAEKIPGRIGQASEALDSVPLIAETVAGAGIDAPSLEGLASLIEGEIDAGEWVAGLRRAERTRKAA